MTSFFNKRLAQAQHALETINKTLEGLPRAQALNQPILSIYLLIVELWILAGLHVEKAEASQRKVPLCTFKPMHVLCTHTHKMSCL